MNHYDNGQIVLNDWTAFRVTVGKGWVYGMTEREGYEFCLNSLYIEDLVKVLWLTSVHDVVFPCMYIFPKHALVIPFYIVKNITVCCSNVRHITTRTNALDIRIFHMHVIFNDKH